jgi:cellulose synthase operon protein YhjQ
MGPYGKDSNEDVPATETSEDASALYSWSNLHGAKYRDFSISRRDYRAHLRHRAAQQASEHAVLAQAEAGVATHAEVQYGAAQTSAGQEQAARYAGSERRRSSLPQTPVHSDTGQGRRAEDEIKEQKISKEPQLRSPQALHVSEPATPAWLYAGSAPPASPGPSVADTLQQSRERVASRWFALQSAFEPASLNEPLPVRQKETRTPVLAVFSLAGGVGKTSLVATVGRALSSMGEKVLLTDTTSHGLLPFYFGASELRHGTVRTFSPPSGSTDAPIYLVSHDMEEKGRDEEAQELFVEEVVGNSQGTHRILLDLTMASGWVIRRMARMNPTVLIPVAPDMNSVISLQFVEKFFHGISDGDGRPLQPFYILNQFDSSLPLHLDVREVLRRQLGERLLSFVVRRAPSVSEALAEGMTIVDYAPDEPVADDYINVATWLRGVAAPAMAGFRKVRWSEREE